MYNQPLGEKVLLFAEAYAFVQFGGDGIRRYYAIPVNVYGTYAITRKLFPFVQLSMLHRFDDNMSMSSRSFVAGVGVEYQFTKMISANIFYNDVISGYRAANWTTASMGLRVVF